MAKAKAKTIETIDDLKPDASNVNLGTERGGALMDYSVTQFGLWRSITASADGVVPAGNQTLKEAKKRGVKIIPVHTKGDELVVVVRDDITSDDPRFRQYAHADNEASHQNYARDIELILEQSQSVDLTPIYGQDGLDAMLASLTPPNFEPAGIEEQGRLDEKAKVTCPECGHQF